MPTSIPRPGSEPSRSGSAVVGFTLVEVAVILFIVAVAATLLLPRLRDADSTALAASARRLATTARYLYEESAFSSTPMRLNLDIGGNTYWVTVLNDDPETPEFVPADAALAAPVRLPSAVEFADAVLPALGTVKEGQVFVQFLPEGYADALVLHLRNRRNEYVTLAIEPLTGRTRVADGYHEVQSQPYPQAGDAPQGTSARQPRG